MNIEELEQKLKEIREEYGNLPVLMLGKEMRRWASWSIEDVKVVVYPPGGNPEKICTNFYVAALCNDGMAL